MDMLRRFLGVAGSLLATALQLIGVLLRGIVGDFDWQPPRWLQLLTGFVVAGLASLLNAAKALSPTARIGIAASLALAAAAFGGWRWHENHRPLAVITATVPQNVAFAVDDPKLTCYDCSDPAQRQPKPMTLRFEASIAPLELVGKDLPATQTAVRVSPAQPGTWRWQDDRTLVFSPGRDWPVGVHYEGRLDTPQLALKGVTLAREKFQFASAPFRLWTQESSFVQDPVNPATKTAQFLLRFSHPVDAESFKRRLSLRYFELSDRGDAVERTAPPYTLSYDDGRTSVSLRTATMALAADAGRLELRVDDGVVSTLGGDAAAKQVSMLDIPGRGALKITEVKASIARDADDTPVQTLTVQLSQSTTEAEVRGKVKAWLLPFKHPDAKTQKAWEDEAKGNAAKPYPWNEASAALALKKAETLPLTYNALEAEHADIHSFRHKAEPGRLLFLRVPAGIQSFGGYELTHDFDTVLQVPAFAPELRLTHSGALLAMSGAKKLTIFTRDVPGVKVEIGRLLPQQIQHLVTQSNGRLDAFNWQNWNFNEDNISEHFTKELSLPKLRHGEAHYEPLDLAPYLAQGESSRRGIFFLRLSGYDPATKQAVAAKPRNENNDDDGSNCEEGCEGDGEGPTADYGARTSDTRLIVVTDLGLVTKRNKDGSQDVFVQSIASGDPQTAVTIDVIGKNGSTVLTRTTDADGHARLPELKGYERERAPVLLLAHKGGDQSFLPLDGRSGNLDLSRFDIGGVSQAVEPGALSAFFFTDRGLYRPGESAHIGVIVKASEFAHALPATPVLYEISDPRGAVVYKTVRTLPAQGLDELAFATAPSAASGSYTVTAWLPGASGAKNDRKRLGSLDFRVREFEPDRLKIAMNLNAVRANGWLRPEAVTGAQVDLQNLFGTAAQNRRVTGELKLTPWLPSFEGFRDYQFTDPQAAKEGVTVNLQDGKTDENGKAELAIDLTPYAATSYWLRLTTQGFEPDGGRGVTAEAGQVVSSLPYLVGWKSEDPLWWIAKDAKPQIRLVAIDPEAKATLADGLKLRRYERKWVSVLTRSDSGYYRYESRLKDTLLSEVKFSVPVAGRSLTLETAQPGNFLYTVVDGNEQAFARVPYEVAGYGNVTRSLDKNAELKLSLSKKDYAAGDDIEVSLVAPFAGAGLITIEREKVLAWKWFKSSTTASVQKIKVPAGLEGSAYVHVMFTRDPASEDTYTAPLSYGVAPFSVAIDARRAPLTLDAPAKIKPGETLSLHLKAAKPGRALVYAVDEGILQVARYKTPDPLGFYFQKRSLDVRTLQILDLILPEFRGLPIAAAPGGDADAALGAKLNPFKRKTDAPIAWWSGLVDVGPDAKTLTWTVPDRFNGALRLVAISVAPEAIGVAENKTLVRGDFTLLPNAPLAVTPGDEFEVSTGVANNLESAPKNAPIEVSLTPSDNLEVIGPSTLTIPISALHEGVARYRVRAKDKLGSAELAFGASYQGKTAKLRSTLSVRPPNPYSPNLATVLIEPGKSFDIPVTHAQDFYPEFRKVEASVSALPLVMAHGLSAYLGGYSYHCTEQLMSMAMPALVLATRPEFGSVNTEHGSSGFSGLFNELALRQRPEGDFSLWNHGGYAVEPVSIYTLHFLLEASDRGLSVPPGMIESGNRFLTAVARRKGGSYYEDRDAAYAIYLLTRQGQLMSAEADALVKRLESRDKGWRQDSSALWLAAAYARMQQKTQAEALVSGVQAESGRHRYAYDHGFYYASDLSAESELLYIIAKHFPNQLAKLGPVLARSVADQLNRGYYDSYGSGTTLLALDAYATAAAQEQGKFSVAEVAADGTLKPLSLPDGKLPKVAVSKTAAKLRVTNAGNLPTYAVLAELGFMRTVPELAQSHGIEVLRRFLNAAGQSVDKAALGEQLKVEIRLRALDRTAITDIAMVDLLPGGFEIVQPPIAAAGQTLEQSTPEEGADPASDDAAAAEAADGEIDAGQSASLDGSGQYCRDCSWVTVSGGQLKFAEPREDRAVLYADATRSVQTFVYTIKAVTAGRFIVPPAYAEAMYDRTVYAHSAGGTIEVVKP